AQMSGWKSISAKLLPGLAAVGRSIEPAAGTGQRSVRAPRRPVRFPHRSEQNIRSIRCHGEIRGSDCRALIQNLVPGLAAIAGFEHAALLVTGISVPERRNEHQI